jgi:hypothetical protein
MSSRLLVLTLIASLGSGSIAFAEEGLLQSGSRIVQQVVRGQEPDRIHPARAEAHAAQEQPALSKSGLSRRTKVMIYLAAGVGFAFAAYTIDHNGLNVTPSSLGTRKD